ncbi:SDR family oxidoreductase [Teichococcus aestuarii]|uniref:SDR family oxidoreductase n=1 Tax=Teichococcus aestuarii TaxID=568898 RepID=UPI00360D4944
MGQRFEAVTDAINHRASVDVAKAAAEAGVKRFVFASSCSVYGFAADGRARVEEDQLNPLTAYARSKIDTETSLRALDNSGMVVSCLRFATACGMSPRLRLDLVLNDFVAGALANGEVSVLSDGTPWRPLIHVRDMARAIEWAIIRAPENGGNFLTVNVGTERWNYRCATWPRRWAAPCRRPRCPSPPRRRRTSVPTRWISRSSPGWRRSTSRRRRSTAPSPSCATS